MATRKPFVGGNWKMSANIETVSSMKDTLAACGEFAADVDVVVTPSAIHAGAVASMLPEGVTWGVQNVAPKPGFTALTGEISADMAKDAGAAWAVAGHSERRAFFAETSEVVADKVKLCLDAGVKAILCVGETLEQREADQASEVVLGQLNAVAKAIGTAADTWAQVVVAYEPVWAIGTGRVASPEQAQDMHAAIRAWAADALDHGVADSLRIIYGGSVKGANAAGLISQADIDGFLVGGASLQPQFRDIVAAAAGKE